MARKEIDIVPMVIPGGPNGVDSHIIDLKIDDIVIESAKDPFRSYQFWDQLWKASNRAIYKLKKLNPTRRLDISLSNFGSTPQEREDAFHAHLTEKYPSVNKNKTLAIIEEKFASMTLMGDAEGHPNPEMLVPLNGDLSKSFIFSVIEALNKNEVEFNGEVESIASLIHGTSQYAKSLIEKQSEEIDLHAGDIIEPSKFTPGNKIFVNSTITKANGTKYFVKIGETEILVDEKDMYNWKQPEN